MASFDPADLPPGAFARMLSGTVIPRPIALVTTLGEGGVNAAPFSFFNLVCADPSMLMFSASAREGAAKDTVRNIEALPEFVVHIVPWREREKMNRCSAELPYGIDEVALAGFRTVPSLKVRPPRLADCPVQLECRLERTVKLGTRPYTMVIGEIVLAHYDDGIVDASRHHVDVDRIDAMGRMQGDTYARLTDRFAMPRP